MQGWGGSCRGGVGHEGVGWVMQGWGGVGHARGDGVGHAGVGGVDHAGVGWVMQGRGGSCRGGVGHAEMEWGHNLLTDKIIQWISGQLTF